MEKIRQFGTLFIIVASLLWSFDGVLRRGLYTLPPTVVVFYEHLLGALLLTPFLFATFKEIKKMGKKEWISIAVVSLFSGTLGTVFYTAALGMVSYIPFSVVVLLQQLQPVWAILTASVLLKEKITRGFILWSSLAITASYFVTFKDLHVNFASDKGTIVAALLAFLAGFVWAVSTSFSKIVLKKVSFVTATGLRFWLAPVFALIFILFQNQTKSLSNLTLEQWSSLLLITFTTGMVALLIYYYGLKKVPARISAICELTWPISAVFIDYFLFNQILSLTQIIGVIVLLLSMFKVTQMQKISSS